MTMSLIFETRFFMQAFFSNRTEILYQHLKQELFKSSIPFCRRLIIAPSPAMKSWLITSLAKDPDLGISMGIEIDYFDAMMKKIQELFLSASSARLLNQMELSIAIEGEIYNILEQSLLFSNEELCLWNPLLEHVRSFTDSNNFLNCLSLSQKAERRITSLAEILSPLFIKYGKYAPGLTKQWENNHFNNWQIALWQRIFSKWDYPYRIVKRLLETPFSLERTDVEIHLFAMSYIPKLYHHFLCSLSSQLSISYYLLSPCKEFWSDLTPSITNNTQEYTNPLLISLGRLGREMALHIEETPIDIHSSYSLPNSIVTEPSYHSFYFEDLNLDSENSPLSILNTLQADLLLLRNPNVMPPLLIPLQDNSIQCHAAPNPMREVQILQDRLIEILNAHSSDKTPIYPQDILVMTPDIKKYAPYIETVFNGPNGLLKAQILDTPSLEERPLWRCFLHLLSLHLRRWEVSAVLSLFDQLPFQKKQKFYLEEVKKIEEWIRQTDISWGITGTNRSEILAKEHGQKILASEEHGTWENAFEKILEGLILSPENSQSVDPTDSILCGRWIYLMRSLFQDIKVLQSEVKTFSDWQKHLQLLLETYCDISEHEEEARQLQEAFQQLKTIESKLGNRKVSFRTVYHYIKKIIDFVKEHNSSGSQAILFCAMLPMRAVPASVIVLLGLNEESYPRSDPSHSLDLMAHSKNKNNVDYSPSQTDYDRFLFLEAILSARKYFLMTYCCHAVDHVKAEPPSLLVTELFSYLEQSLGKKSIVIHYHPLYPFDKSYFLPSNDLKSYDDMSFLAAQAYYQINKEPEKNFIQFSILSKNPPINNSEPISISSLNAIAYNPIKAYFNKTLKIYLKRGEEQAIEDNEAFTLSPLKKFHLKSLPLKTDVNMVIKKANLSGFLPLGLFKPFSIDTVVREMMEMREKLHSWEINENDLFEIHLSEVYRHPHQDAKGNWLLPLLSCQLENQLIQVKGSLFEVSKKGLVVRIKGEKTDITKIWPEYLLFTLVLKEYGLNIEPNLLAIGGKKAIKKELFFTNSKTFFEEYLTYYFAALNNASPLLPEWIPQLVLSTPESFSEWLKKKLKDPFHPINNDYLHWAIRNWNAQGPEKLIYEWKPWADCLFSKLYECWY